MKELAPAGSPSRHGGREAEVEGEVLMQTPLKVDSGIMVCVLANGRRC